MKATGVRYKPVPDFDRIYRNFESSMAKKKNSRMLTVIEPFSFDDEVKRVMGCLHETLFLSLRSQRPLHVQGDASHPG
jgi:hypothetical protein